MDTIFLTQAKLDQVARDYQAAQTERAATLVRLQIAREQGDLSENGAYKYAKIQLGDVGRVLRELKFLLDNAQVLVKNPHPTVVELGCTVEVRQGARQRAFMIVSKYEADPQLNQISAESPLGLALHGKKVGDSAEVETPAGKTTYSIVNIH